ARRQGGKPAPHQRAGDGGIPEGRRAERDGAGGLSRARGAEGAGGRRADLPRSQPGTVLRGWVRRLRQRAVPGLPGRRIRGLADGAPVNEEATLLERAGVVGPEAQARSYLLAACGPVEAERWTTFALGLVGKKPPEPGLRDGALDMSDLAVYFARSLGWEERLRLSLDDKDLPYLLAFKDRDDVPKEAQRAYAMLI